MDYNSVTSIELECTCVDCGSLERWEELMDRTKRANKRVINKLVKVHLPELYESLCLKSHNPYTYYRTEKHLILVHSAIEYFLRFTI